MKNALIAAVCAASLTACTTANYTYAPVVNYAPNMQMTEAKCQMLSSGTQQGYFAYGSQSYVAGAAIGNAIGNAIRADQFVQQCMMMNGWKRVPLSPATQKAIAANANRSAKGPGPFPPKPK